MAIGNPQPAASTVQWILTPKGRLTFANLFKAKPHKLNPSKIGYWAVLVFEPPSDITRLKNLAWEIGKTKFGEAAARMPEFVWPFKTLKGDEKSFQGFPAGSVTLQLSSQFQPQLCDQARQAVISPDVIYSGCYIHAMTSAYPWEFAGKRGVSFNLGNVQKIADGPRLDNRRTIEQDFEPLPGAEGGSGGSSGSGSPLPF